MEKQDTDLERQKTVRAPSLLASGKRKTIEPVRLDGYYASQRRRLSWLLFVIYLVAPWIKIDERPLILLDFTKDSYWVFFTIWHRTDAFYLLAVLLLLLISLFIATAIKGRIWCGYACPQTVFLDWLIRPLEEFFEGNAYKRAAARGKKKGSVAWLRKIAKHTSFLFRGFIVGNTALMYFTGPSKLFEWIQSSPSANPAAFGMMMGITALFYFDFAWFREQFCSFVCPYARFQAILLDEDSPTVHYKEERGEARGRGKNKGDCIDCGLCVRVCPTGIDIRDGLQLECIQCLRCVDACNSVMTSLKRPKDLISWGSPTTSAAKSQKHASSAILKPRLLVYAAVTAALLGICTYSIVNRKDVEFTLIRQPGSALTNISDSTSANVFQIRITNTTSRDISLTVKSADEKIQVICGACQSPITAFASKRASLVLSFDRTDFVKEVSLVFTYGEKEELIRIPIINRTQASL